MDLDLSTAYSPTVCAKERVHLRKSGSARDVYVIFLSWLSGRLLKSLDFFSGNLDASLQTLTRAKDLRSRLLKRVQVEQPDIVMDQKQLTAKVTVCMCVCPV